MRTMVRPRHRAAPLPARPSEKRELKMIRKLILAALSVVALTSGSARAEVAVHIEDVAFSFEGPFGSFDKHQLQRGLQVYTEVCAACHGLQYVPIRTLADEGGPELPDDQVRAYAAAFPVLDEDSNRQLYDPEKQEFRALTSADSFPANRTQKAPDLSLIAKNRAAFHGPYGLGINQLFQGTGGPEYVTALLSGYHEAPACATGDEEGYYNVAFANGGIPDSCKDEKGLSTIPGSWIAMPPPISDGQVEYVDGHDNDLHHISMDVAAFLMWTAEPKMMARKEAGFSSVVFLIILSVLLYLTNKRVWAAVKGRKDAPKS